MFPDRFADNKLLVIKSMLLEYTSYLTAAILHDLSFSRWIRKKLEYSLYSPNQSLSLTD